MEPNDRGQHRLFHDIEIGELTFDPDPFSLADREPSMVAKISGCGIYMPPQSFPEKISFILYAATADGVDDESELPWPCVHIVDGPHNRGEIAILLLIQPEILKAIPKLLQKSANQNPAPDCPAPDW